MYTEMAAAAAITVIRNIETTIVVFVDAFGEAISLHYFVVVVAVFIFRFSFAIALATPERKNEHQRRKEHKKKKTTERENEIAYFGRRRCIDSHFSSFPKPIDEQHFAKIHTPLAATYCT